MSSPARSRAASSLTSRLRALGAGATLLHVGAHPDDEQSALIARVSLGDGAHAAYWSATRGEGGQNAVGAERGEALGIIRTWESLAARRFDGGEVLYGPFYDFGYSKRGAETLARWGRDRLVDEIVRAIRVVRPQVVVSRWSGGPGDGHGHHQAIGLVIEEAFDAAGEPARGPSLPSWSPVRLYRSLAGDWQAGEEDAAGGDASADGDVWIDAGEIEPESGRTFEELAREGCNRHRSQGFALLPRPGSARYGYRLLRGPADGGEGFFAGIDTSLAALCDRAGEPSPAIADALNRAQKAAQRAYESFHPHRPRAVIAALAEGLAALGEAESAARRDGALIREIRRRRAAFAAVVADCSGIRVEASAAAPRATPGSTLPVIVRVWGAAGARVRLEAPAGFAVAEGPSTGAEEPETGGPRRFEVRIPVDAAFSVPYWLRESRAGDVYAVGAGDPDCAAMEAPAMRAVVEADVDGAGVSVVRPVTFPAAFPGGARALPPAIVPPIGLRPAEHRRLLPSGERPRRIEMVVESEGFDDDAPAATLHCEVPGGWSVHPPSYEATCAAGRTAAYRFEIVVPAGAAGREVVRFRAETGGRSYDGGLEPVRRTDSFLPADASTAVMEAFMPVRAHVEVLVANATFDTTLRYGYVRGDEPSLARALSEFGLEIAELTDEQIALADLSAFDAIVIGPRGYAVRPTLTAHAPRLTACVEAGGTVITLAQSYGYDSAGSAPLAIRYAHPHDRVTAPDAPVTILEPAHAIFSAPNRITAADFGGWSGERGRYFAAEWDPRLVPLLACADDGEVPARGGLLAGGLGRGTFVYCGYSLARQIDAGVEGAIRLLANLLALPESRIREKMEHLGRVPLFAGLTGQELHRVARLASQRWFAPGELLCRQGDRSEELYVVTGGSVDVLKESGRAIATAGVGSVIGELAVISEAPRSATLRARDGVDTLVLRGAHLRELLRELPDMSERMMTILAAKLAADRPGP